MSAIPSALDRLEAIGGRLFSDGKHVRYSAPDTEEARLILDELRQDREAVSAFVKDRESLPPTLEEVKAALPPGVQLLSYQPKTAPFAVQPVSVVTNSGRFYRAYLNDLARRMKKPKGYHFPPLSDILGKLADAGLELTISK